MARMARKRSCTGFYHVMLRGADRRIIFSDDEDNQRFIESMQRVKREPMFQLYTYCLMGNHVHLRCSMTKEPSPCLTKEPSPCLRVVYYDFFPAIPEPVPVPNPKEEAVRYEESEYVLNPVITGLAFVVSLLPPYGDEEMAWENFFLTLR